MSYDPAILLLGTYLTKPKKLIQNSTSTPMFIAALFTVAKIWKQLKFPSTDEWLNNYETFIQWNTRLQKKEINYPLRQLS